jgi:hypothetical protein
VPRDSFAPRLVDPGNTFPIEVWKKVCQRLALHIGLQAHQPRDGLIEVKYPPMLIHDQDAIFDGIEQGFEETPFAREAAHDSLETLRIEPPDAAQDFIKETGFGRHTGLRASVSF